MQLGRYQTIRPIASGGMATVYLGRVLGSQGFERRVAIKVMHQHVADDPEFITMFLDEARLAARIHHHNVVSTLDVQNTDAGIFLVMEYIEGSSLRDMLRTLSKRRERIPVGVAVRILADALSGLHAAHELVSDGGMPLNLVHRDVSPHNILVGLDGITRITDFGVARAEARLTSTHGHALKGKIAYMPPEQGLRGTLDRRADVYAAGVVLWETLVGERLFKAEHEGAILTMVLEGATVSPRRKRREVSETIDRVCMRALALDPDERFPTAAAFADALERAAIEAGVSVPNTRGLGRYLRELDVAPRKVFFPSDRAEGPPPSSASALSSRHDTDDTDISGISTSRSDPPPPAKPVPRRWRGWAGASAALLAVAIGVILLAHGQEERRVVAPATAVIPRVHVEVPATSARPVDSARAPEPPRSASPPRRVPRPAPTSRSPLNYSPRKL